jgi:hypothetical protein
VTGSGGRYFLASLKEGEQLMSTIEVGDLLYEYTVKFTGMTEYGVSLESLMAGNATPPPEGARFDVAFEGASTGPKLNGKVTGVDYLQIRADGRFQLHIHAEITTDDGEKIAVFADGVALRREGSSLADLRENVTLSTSSKKYSWVNTLQVWASGTVDLAKQVVQLKGYKA